MPYNPYFLLVTENKKQKKELRKQNKNLQKLVKMIGNHSQFLI